MSKPRTAIQVAQELKPYRNSELTKELERRGEPYTTECEYEDCFSTPREFDDAAAETARHYLNAGDLREAAIYIGRAWPDFDRLEQLIARVLPTAGV